jgi:hypothetical protein
MHVGTTDFGHGQQIALQNRYSGEELEQVV